MQIITNIYFDGCRGCRKHEYCLLLERIRGPQDYIWLSDCLCALCFIKPICRDSCDNRLEYIRKTAFK